MSVGMRSPPQFAQQPAEGEAAALTALVVEPRPLPLRGNEDWSGARHHGRLRWCRAGDFEGALYREPAARCLIDPQGCGTRHFAGDGVAAEQALDELIRARAMEREQLAER